MYRYIVFDVETPRAAKESGGGEIMNERQHTKESIGADGLRAETKSKEKKAMRDELLSLGVEYI